MRLATLLSTLLSTLIGAAALAAPGGSTPAEDDWVKSADFKGKKILIACYYWEGNALDSVPMNYVPRRLRRMGFTVDVLRAPPHLPDLEKYDQLWIVSGSGSTFDRSDAEKVKAFLARGRGVYVMADNTPYTHEANVIGNLLHDVSFAGDYGGGQTVNVVTAKEMKRIIDEAMAKGDMDKLVALRRAGFFNGKLYAEDHEILTGIHQIYEGITLATYTSKPNMDVIIRASDNQPLVAISTREGEHLIYDGGFTRLYCGWDQNEETSTKWYRNVAAYLLGRRRADLPKS